MIPNLGWWDEMLEPEPKTQTTPPKLSLITDWGKRKTACLHLFGWILLFKANREKLVSPLTVSNEIMASLFVRKKSPYAMLNLTIPFLYMTYFHVLALCNLNGPLRSVPVNLHRWPTNVIQLAGDGEGWNLIPNKTQVQHTPFYKRHLSETRASFSQAVKEKHSPCLIII